MKTLILAILISSASVVVAADLSGSVIRNGDKLACYFDSKEVPCIFMWVNLSNGLSCNLVNERQEIYPGSVAGIEYSYCQAVVK